MRQKDKGIYVSYYAAVGKTSCEKKTTLYFNLWYSARLPANDGTEVIYTTEGISTLLM